MKRAQENLQHEQQKPHSNVLELTKSKLNKFHLFLLS